MNTSDINRVLKSFDQFGGTIPADAIRYVERNKFYVVNTDPAHLEGSHWVTLFTGTLPEFYDSLGRSPSFYENSFEAELINLGPNYLYNSSRIQGRDSESCGWFCIYYIVHRISGNAFKDIVDSFDSTDWESNEDRLKRFRNEWRGGVRKSSIGSTYQRTP